MALSKRRRINTGVDWQCPALYHGKPCYLETTVLWPFLAHAVGAELSVCATPTMQLHMVPPIGLIREYLAKENSQTFSELGYSSPSREALELTRRSSTDLPFIPYQLRSTSCREYVDLRCGSGLTLIQES